MNSVQIRSDFHPPLLRRIKRNRQLLYMLLLPLAYYILFCYLPMYGVLIAFKDYQPVYGKSFFRAVLDAPWVGFEHIQNFISSYNFTRVMRNTVLMFLYSMLFGFPLPIFFALLLNEIRHARVKKFVQTVSYLPHFISTVSLVGMLTMFLSPRSGFINRLIVALGGEKIYFLAEPRWFRTIFVASGIWQGLGWSAIIYLAAISTVDVSLYEAAVIDGANRWQQMWHITVQAIKPTIAITLIMSLTGILNTGGDKIILMYQPITYETADTISSYVYRVGMQQANYSFSSAVGIFTTVINAAFLLVCNWISGRLTEYSLF